MLHKTRWTLPSLKGPHTLILLLSTVLLLPLFAIPVSSTPAVLTQRTWGGGSNDYGYSVAVDSSGNTYVTGTTFSFGAGSPTFSDAVLVKYDASGTLVWQKTWGSGTYEQGYGVAVDTSGNIYVTGVNGTGVPGSANIILLKFDSTGLLLWQKTWGTSSEDQALSVAIDSSGNAYVAGYAFYGAGGGDLVLLKISSSGSLLWQKTWGGSLTDRGSSVAVDSSGSIYVTGTTFSFGAGNADLVLLKFDGSGTLLWHRRWGGTLNDEGLGAAVDTSNNIYITGHSYNFGAGNEDIILLKFDSTGTLLWQRTWGGSGSDRGFGIATTSTGSVHVTGRTDSFGAGLTDATLLTFDPSGGLVSQKLWGSVNGEYGWGVAADASASAVVTGHVSNAQPYTLNSGTVTPNNPTFTAGPTGNSTLGAPAFALKTPAFTPATPSGNQAYAGGTDMFLFKYGDLPKITFQTSPSVGSITINGAAYTNGQNSNYTSGEYTATVNVPSGYAFTSWTTSGGVTVASTTSNPTTVTIIGPGTLTANLITAPLSSPESPLLLVAVAAITAVVVAGAMFFLLGRRKKTAPG